MTAPGLSDAPSLGFRLLCKTLMLLRLRNLLHPGNLVTNLCPPLHLYLIVTYHLPSIQELTRLLQCPLLLGWKQLYLYHLQSL